MKRVFLLVAAGCLMVLLAISCGSKKEEAGSESEDVYSDYEIAEQETTTPETGDELAQGKALIEASDCKTCHHETNKIIGPAHKEVAEKYEFTAANVTMLAEKIIKGGSGVWGDIMMTPHANLSQADAEKMSRYILSLDGEEEK